LDDSLEEVRRLFGLQVLDGFFSSSVYIFFDKYGLDATGGKGC
jgi:hypothetical protein